METQKPVAFEEFKLFYESAEKVTERRLEMNRWNYSINVAILIAVAAITNWSLQNPPLFWLGIVAACILCLMAIFFCQLWIGQVADLKKLNNAKFGVLAEMAPLVEFNVEFPGLLESYQPFAKEWVKLQELNGLRKLGNSSIKVLGASHHEYFIPRAYQILFGVLFLMLLTIAVKGNPTAMAQTPPSASSQQKTP